MSYSLHNLHCSEWQQFPRSQEVWHLSQLSGSFSTRVFFPSNVTKHLFNANLTLSVIRQQHDHCIWKENPDLTLNRMLEAIIKWWIGFYSFILNFCKRRKFVLIKMILIVWTLSIPTRRWSNVIWSVSPLNVAI